MQIILLWYPLKRNKEKQQKDKNRKCWISDINRIQSFFFSGMWTGQVLKDGQNGRMPLQKIKLIQKIYQTYFPNNSITIIMHSKERVQRTWFGVHSKPTPHQCKRNNGRK